MVARAAREVRQPAVDFVWAQLRELADVFERRCGGPPPLLHTLVRSTRRVLECSCEGHPSLMVASCITQMLRCPASVSTTQLSFASPQGAQQGRGGSRCTHSQH